MLFRGFGGVIVSKMFCEVYSLVMVPWSRDLESLSHIMECPLSHLWRLDLVFIVACQIDTNDVAYPILRRKGLGDCSSFFSGRTSPRR